MSKSLTFEEQYQAIVRKDVTYEGVFYTAVKTTGIFCRPTCTARKPKCAICPIRDDCLYEEKTE